MKTVNILETQDCGSPDILLEESSSFDSTPANNLEFSISKELVPLEEVLSYQKNKHSSALSMLEEEDCISDKSVTEIFEFLFCLGYRNKKDKFSSEDIPDEESDVVITSYGDRSSKKLCTLTMPQQKTIKNGFKLNGRRLDFADKRRGKKVHDSIYALWLESGSLSNKDVYVQSNKHRLEKQEFTREDGRKFVDGKAIVDLAHISRLNHIIIECDDTSLEEQYKIINVLKPYLSAVVYSGNESIHLWISFKEVHCNGIEKENHKQYAQPYKNAIEDILVYNGLADMVSRFDTSVYGNLNAWTRLPNMKHHTTDTMSRILYLNSNPTSLLPSSTTIPTLGDTPPVLKGKTDTFELEEAEQCHPTSLSSSTTIPTLGDTPQEIQGFIDNGIPRHSRREVAKLLIKTKNIDHISIFKAILDNPLTEIGMSKEDALSEFIEWYDQIKRYSNDISKVDPTAHPIFQFKTNIEALKLILQAKGYQEPYYCSKMIIALLQLIKTGRYEKLAIGSGMHINRREFYRGSHPSKYIAVKDELEKHGLVVCTSHYSNYSGYDKDGNIVPKQAKTYRFDLDSILSLMKNK